MPIGRWGNIFIDIVTVERTKDWAGRNGKRIRCAEVEVETTLRITHSLTVLDPSPLPLRKRSVFFAPFCVIQQLPHLFLPIKIF